MRRRGRVWRVGKWVGVALFVLTALAWGVSLLSWSDLWVRTWGVQLSNGQIRLVRFEYNGAPQYIAKWQRPNYGWEFYWGSWRAPTLRDRLGLTLPRIFRWMSRSEQQGSVGGRGVALPLWLPLLISAPAAFLWYRDRRRPPPGHCQRCGYDLTGNVSGRCSECGEKV
jgi:hypothetical protein